MDTITTTQPLFNLQTLTLTPPQPPPSVAALRHVSAALLQFLRDYDDLHNHISSINQALDQKLSAHYKGNDFALLDDNSFVVVPNPRCSVSDCVLTDDSVLKGVVSERKRDECVLSDNVLEGVVLERKRKGCVVDSDDDDDVRMRASSYSFVNDSDRVVNDDVLGGVVSEGVKDCEKSDFNGVVNDVLGDVNGSESDEGVVVTNGKSEGSVSEGEYERSDEYANYVKKREESDCDRVVDDVLEGVFVTEGKSEGSDVDVRMYELKKREESDCDRVVSNDLAEIGLEGKSDGNVRMYPNVKNEEEVIDTLVKMEESDCDEIIIDLSEAVFSEQNLNGSESDHIVTEFRDARVSGQSPNSASSECEHGDADVRMDESPNSPESCKETESEGEEIGATKDAEETDNEGGKIDALKNADETDSEGEEIGASKNAEEIGEEGEKSDAAKNVEKTDYDRAIKEFLEEIAVIEKNPVGTASKCDNVRMSQSSSSMEISEETKDEDGEIEESNKPEDADYERIVTELLEDIDVAPKHNRTASDFYQSYNKPQSPSSPKNQRKETGVPMEPGETDIVKDPLETDVLEKPEEIVISAKPVGTGVLEKLEQIDILKNPAETDVSGKPAEIDNSKNPEETDVSKKPEVTDLSEKPENVEILKNPKPAISDLERLCKTMSGRELKKYVVKHIFDIDKLRAELSKALKLAINPSKLVLDSIGTFFLHSGKTYNSGSYLNDGRQASILILECFVMISDGIAFSREDKVDAADAAKLWKARMIKEGGLQCTEEADARGLLLLISGFGISDRLFDIVDIMDLMRASNVKGISNILRRSIVLMPKIPEVIDMMVMSKLEVEAADMAYTFGLEYKCHPLTILKKFLRYIIEDIERGSPVQIEAMKQQLHHLISIKKCLESHKIDPSEALREFKIETKILHLKKELKLQVQKRKATDIESSPNPNLHEAKRTCSSHQTMAPGISSYNHPMQPGYSYHDFNPNRSSNYIPPSLLNRPALPVNLSSNYIPPSVLGPTSGLAGPSGNTRSYSWQDESALAEKYLVQPYPIQSQIYDSQPSLTGLRGRQPGSPVCMPGHPGYPRYFPSGGFPARRGPRSDLYAFADVVEREMRGSRAVGSGTGRPSY